MPCNADLFSRLFTPAQTRDGNLEQLFDHENQSCQTPAKSKSGIIRQQ